MNRIPHISKFIDVIPICHSIVSVQSSPPHGADFDGLVSTIDSGHYGAGLRRLVRRSGVGLRKRRFWSVFRRRRGECRLDRLHGDMLYELCLALLFSSMSDPLRFVKLQKASSLRFTQ